MCVIPAGAQSVIHDWAKGIGSSDFDLAYSISATYPGYIYVAGSFSGTVDFDPGSGVTNLTSDGAKDGFVLKLDTAGVLIWARKIGGTLNQSVYSLVVDTIGGVYLTGSHSGTTDLDPGAAFQNVVSNGEDDIFIAHLDSAGSYIWGRSVGGSSYDNGNAIVVDTLGNVYVTGTYRNTVDFDPGPGIVSLTFNGIVATWADIFLAKFDINGSLVWAKGIGGATFDTCRSLALDDQLNIYITGGFVGAVDFDPGPGIFMMTSPASNVFYAFIVKLNNAGDFVWAGEFGGGWGGSSMGLSVVTDNSGSILITGRVSGLVDFDPGPGFSFTNINGSYDVFVAKLDGAGNLLWAKSIGGIDEEHAYSIKADGSGNVYIGGSSASYQVDFDPGPGFFRLSNNTTGRISFLVKLNSAGDFYWARTFGGGNSNMYTPWSVVDLDHLSNIFLTGNYGQITPLDFDPGPAVYALSNAGVNDIYVMKLKQANCGLPVYSTSFANVCDSITINTDTYTQTGNYTVLFSNSSGCDSISNITLSIYQSSPGSLSIVSCDSFNFNGHVYTSGGVYLDTLTNVVGCDSIVTLQLTLFHSSFDTLVQSACDSFVLNGTAYYSTGFHSQHYFGANGCDSTIVLNLTILGYQDTISHSSCNLFVYNGNTYTTSGYYPNSFTSVNSCDSLVVVDLTINSVDVSVSNTSSTVSAGATGASYQWIDCNGFVPIPGETNQSFAFTQAGSYAVAVTQNGCTDTSVCLVVSSIDDPGEDGNMKLYPNPGDGIVTIEVQSPLRDAVIRIVDVSGRIVQTLSGVKGSKISLDLINLSSGTYVIEIVDAGGVRRGRFSKL